MIPLPVDSSAFLHRLPQGFGGLWVRESLKQVSSKLHSVEDVYYVNYLLAPAQSTEAHAD